MQSADPTDTITGMSASDLVRRIRTRELSCIEVTDAHLARIDALNPLINAFCTVLHDDARKAAREADSALASGQVPGSLHGLPVALKDLTPTKGIRTTRGSLAFADDIPGRDALIVERIRQAGGIIIGKTNTPEFGHKCVTDNLLFGPTRNPWNLERIAGGSSGGSAAAVAAGMVPLAEGSDGAGSIRIPAAMCGVVGFKPGYGQVPTVTGPFSSHSPFLHNGPLARSVTDAAMLYQAMAGGTHTDPFSVSGQEDALRALDDDLAGLRVGWSTDLGCFAVDPEVRTIFERAAQAFTELGCEVKEVAPGFDRSLETHFMVLWCTRLATACSALNPGQLALLEPEVRALIDEGERYSAIDYGRANLARETVWNRLLAIHDQCDLLLCPTTAIPSFPIKDGPPQRIHGTEIDPLLGWILTWPFNLSGHPAASIPCGHALDGMPVGMQIVGRRFDDALVLRAAQGFERIKPWPRVATPTVNPGRAFST